MLGTVVAVVTVVLLGSSLTGNNEKLCAAMGGKYTPNSVGAEQCPGGAWSNIVRRG